MEHEELNRRYLDACDELNAWSARASKYSQRLSEVGQEVASGNLDDGARSLLNPDQAVEISRGVARSASRLDTLTREFVMGQHEVYRAECEPAAILGRLLAKDFPWCRTSSERGARLAHARVFFRFWIIAVEQVRRTASARAREASVEQALTGTIQGYWLLARVAGAGIYKLAGIGTSARTPIELRQWLAQATACRT